MDFGVTDLLVIRYSAFVRYRRKVGGQWDSTSVSYRFREGLWLSKGRRISQYSRWICNTYGTSYADQNVFKRNL